MTIPDEVDIIVVGGGSCGYALELESCHALTSLSSFAINMILE